MRGALASRELRRRPRVAVLVESASFYGRQVLEGLSKYVRRRLPWSVILEQRGLRNELPGWIHTWDGDGVISRATSPQLISLLARAGIPLVDLTDRTPPHDRCPQVWADNHAIADLAAQHLLERGFTRFAVCGFSGESWSEERIACFSEIVEARGHACARYDSPWAGLAADSTVSWEEDQQRLAAWLETLPRPLGVFACNDLRAQQVTEACARVGLAVPEDVAVIGVDDDEMVCSLCDPALSSVVPAAEQIGWAAAELLDRMMSGARVPAQVHRVRPLGVSTRQSTDVLAIEDTDVANAVRFIREHACSGITVDAVLAAFPLSRSVMERRFRKHFGRSPRAVIRQTQLKEVKRLLRETDLKLERVAALTGFKHTEHMCVVFKRELGRTPGQFRAAR